MTLTLAFLLHKRVNAVQEIHVRHPPCLFQRDKIDQEPKPENSTNLIEMMPIPPRQTPDS